MSVPITVVGLGPAGAEWMVPAARGALGATERRFTRTAHHPAVTDLAAEGITCTAFDDLYDSGADLEAVYGTIVARLVAAAAEGPVVYAVPGSPTVAERTVELLGAHPGVTLTIVPGISFAELAWARLGVDPLDGTRVVDARRFAIDAAGVSGRLLIAQCDSVLVLSDVKLALLDVLEPDHPVTVLARLGRSDEQVQRVPLADLDRVVQPDHLTSVFVDTGALAVAPEFARLYALAQRLRGPGGCPWDAKQTHHSLSRHTLEEAYEVLEAIEALPADAPKGDFDLTAYDALEDELGDLLFQVCIHSVLASETGAFDVADVARRIHDKLVHRHPHVFGEVEVDGADDVVRNWEQIKQQEKQLGSLMDGLPSTLPALLYVPKLFRKAASLDGAPTDTGTGLVREALGRATEAGTEAGADAGVAAVGELLAAVVALAYARGVDAEAALRAWAARYRAAFQALEAEGAPVSADALWRAAAEPA